MSGLREKILGLNPTIPPQAVDHALAFLDNPKVTNKKHMVIVDFSLSDAKDRFHFINLETGEAEHFKVAHGKSSDQDKDNIADHFSNVSGSYQSSLGAMVIGAGFSSPKWKVSHLMDGLEKGLNDHVRAREILWHSTKYVDDGTASSSGDTLGCFGMSEAAATHLHPLVPGCLLFAWHPQLEGQVVKAGGATSFREGATGEIVKQIQAVVGAIPDGVWGAQTTKAVKAYQFVNDLVADGVVGEKTLAKMGLVPEQKPIPTPDDGTLAPAIAIIKEFEVSNGKPDLRAYLDPVNIPTIGFGTIQYPDGRMVKMGDTCTADQAEEWLMFEVNEKTSAMKKLIKVAVTNNQFCALTSFCYNLGVGALQSSTLLRLLNAGAPKEQVGQEFMKWVNAGGKPLNGLIRRRKAEQALFLA